MNRRRFISLLALGCPTAVVAEKLGLIDRIRSYFFAPKGGTLAPSHQAHTILVSPFPFEVGHEFTIYGSDGSPRTDQRLVITSIDHSRNIVTFATLPA